MIAYIMLLILGVRLHLGWLWTAACICGVIDRAIDRVSEVLNR